MTLQERPGATEEAMPKLTRRTFAALLGAVAAPVPLPRQYSEPLAPLVAEIMRSVIPAGGRGPIEHLTIRKDALLALCLAIGQGADHWAFTWGDLVEGEQA